VELKLVNILCVHSSPSRAFSSSRQIGIKILKELESKFPLCKVTTRDLSVDAPPHWGVNEVAASFTPKNARTENQRQALALSDLLCGELLECETLIITAPMWNFGIPSVLKAWIDHIVRAQLTFKYVAGRSEGLLKNIKHVTIVTSAGGYYSTGAAPLPQLDHAGPYLRNVFEFLGAQKIDLVKIEGTAIDRQKAIDSARTF
jgi:FMN-dependent NADH-azoreductase